MHRTYSFFVSVAVAVLLLASSGCGIWIEESKAAPEAASGDKVVKTTTTTTDERTTTTTDAANVAPMPVRRTRTVLKTDKVTQTTKASVPETSAPAAPVAEAPAAEAQGEEQPAKDAPAVETPAVNQPAKTAKPAAPAAPTVKKRQPQKYVVLFTQVTVGTDFRAAVPTRLVVDDGEAYVIPAQFQGVWLSDTHPKDEGTVVSLPQHWELWDKTQEEPAFAPNAQGSRVRVDNHDSVMITNYGYFYIDE